ncbi:MAG: hypothetical protein UX64_C0032G0004 [Microgenomates group bacterium GW2011_GWC2_46_7]|uniref:Uncharacterized protein n=1 Tax=Candidatus Roizmanbacteria bacterium GW2011_GWA2_35_8 TaxID=1618479 RepID=A0A0G0D1X2_9BACT|nr:MAG: hypothetical protein UR89_C0001G0004 [Candidatus Roizmanbacteria bacterium GW2011_GWA2_35_8]KKU45272.1 MAG: hypothetical protein UX64_C0032G0004 [Microgenomates group bacterium GW2011_GWC2_46_7]
MASSEYTSTGIPGGPEVRTFGRLYQTVPDSVNDFQILSEKFASLRSSANGHRRIVMRALSPNEILNEAIASDLPVEAVIPMSFVTGHDSSIIFFGENFHPSPRQGTDIVLNTTIEKKPLEKIESVIKKGFTLSNKLIESDRENLFNLWNRFGWTIEGIVDFINKIHSGEKNLWFSGVRDQTGQLVSASQAEAIEFAGIKYIETTEYSTLDGFEKLGLCTASVEALIAQLLQETYYANNAVNTLLPVITAEFNTSSTSSAVGANAGFIIPKQGGIPQILSYNVAVVDGSPPNQVAFEQWEDEKEIPLRFLRDFAVAVLPRENIENLYPPDVVNKIISLYN